ncbi:S-layer protein [Ammoniphilus oxalaticus]|uniref:S-layer protein n=1 Tax=Ammoniphilus oxalaticus TaxID=66863 RepID=A0A419SJU6_9BACL|nr:S-layer homology domain-containing protein [Ammoniphilus oxalaticus]RKD24230.1 S-layer protein [Ammoniphilus oxalaticus]
MWKRILLCICFCVLLTPIWGGAAQATYNPSDGRHYFFDKSSGFYIRLDNPKDTNISTNYLKELKFTLLWYNRQNSKPNYGYNGIALGVVDVDYNGRASYSRITGTTHHQYTLHDLDTKLEKTTTGYKVPIQIKNLDPKDKSLQNFLGESGKIDIELNYYNVDHPHANVLLDFQDNKDITTFGNKLRLRFPKDSYIADPTLVQSLVPEQRLSVNVFEAPPQSDEYVFLSRQYSIRDGMRRLFAEPSASGDITITYEGVVPKQMEGYNLTMLKAHHEKWVPIGGVVDSAKQTVTAEFDEFGTYAIGLVYKDYGIKPHWARKDVLGLAYKGILQPEINAKDQFLISQLDRPIDRLSYIVLLSKALGFQPLDYQGYFADVSELKYGKDDTGYLMAAVMNGVVFGKEADLAGYNIMAPEQPLTRQEAAAFLARAVQVETDQNQSRQARTRNTRNRNQQNVAADPNSELRKHYRDANRIDEWAKPSVLAVTTQGLMKGNGTHFNPRSNLTFAEASSLIYNLMQKKMLN